MKEREFLEELNLLKEEKVQIDVRYYVMERIRAIRRKRIFVRTLIISPMMFLITMEIMRLLQKAGLMKYIASYWLLPGSLFNSPFVSFIIYVSTISIVLSAILSIFIEGDDINEMLLPSR